MERQKPKLLVAEALQALNKVECIHIYIMVELVSSASCV